MPKDKDLKRVIRSRMQKTGESYTSARAQVLGKTTTAKNKAARSRAGKHAGEFATIAGMSDEAVAAKTGKNWRQWVQALDKAEAATMAHRDIARLIHEQYGVSSWWSQTVTVAYERIRGLRETGQRRGGLFDANKSKTFLVPVSDLYRAFRDQRKREKWMPNQELTIRKASPDKSLRITWDDGTHVDVYFTEKSKAKSSVAIQHRKLSSKAEIERIKKMWSESLNRLAKVLSISTKSSARTSAR